jgi:hypothetical protein
VRSAGNFTVRSWTSRTIGASSGPVLASAG